MGQNLSLVLTELDLSNEVLMQYFAFEITLSSVTRSRSIYNKGFSVRDYLSVVLSMHSQSSQVHSADIYIALLYTNNPLGGE